MSPERAATFERVVAIITPYVRNPEALREVAPSTRLLDDLRVNSARMVDIVLELENAFDIEVGDEDATFVVTVGDAVDVVTRLRG